jgi:hypothetical protein
VQKDKQRIPLETYVNSVVSEGLAVPVPQAIPVVLLLKDTNQRFYNEYVTGHSGSLILQNYLYLLL